MSAVLVYTIGNLFHTPIHDTQLSEDRIHERGLLTVPDEVWRLPVQRAEVIAPLADAVDAAAAAGQPTNAPSACSSTSGCRPISSRRSVNTSAVLRKPRRHCG